MRQRFIFGELKPDQPAHLNDGLMVADGVIPMANGYRPLGQFAALANGGLGAACLGATSYRAGGTVYVLAGTATKLRRYTATGWADLNTGLAASTSIGWRFQEVAGLMLATNGADAIQKFDPASPSAFSALGGTPALARYLMVVRGFVVAPYYDGNPLNVGWSGNGLPESWTPGTDDSGEYEMDTGGDITGGTGGEFGLIFQEGRIVRMTATNDDDVWQWDEISPNLGCQAPWSIAQYGKLTFFLSPKGWKATDGNSIIDIGDEKIDRTFLAEIDRTHLPAMSAAIDQVNGLLVVSVPNANPSTKLYIYHIASGKWTTATTTTEKLFSGLTISVTLEQLDTTFPSLDAMVTSLDDAVFKGGYPELFAFDSSHNVGAFTGTPMAATFTDAEREFAPARRARLREIDPLCDAASGLTLTLATRDTLGAAQTETEYTVRNRGDAFPVRNNARYAQASFSIAAGSDWSHFQGFDAEFMEGGRP